MNSSDEDLLNWIRRRGGVVSIEETARHYCSVYSKQLAIALLNRLLNQGEVSWRQRETEQGEIVEYVIPSQISCSSAFGPTEAYPGTPEKIDILQRRWLGRKPLWHHQDAGMGDEDERW